MKSEKSLYLQFYKIEKEMKMFELKVDNVFYWQLIRFSFLKKITDRNNQVTISETTINYKRRMFTLFIESVHQLIKLRSLEYADIIRIRPCTTVNLLGQCVDHQYDFCNCYDDLSVIDLYALGNYDSIEACVDVDMAPAELKLNLWKIKRKLLGCSILPKKDIDILEKFFIKINEIYGTNFNVKDCNRQLQYNVVSHKIYMQYYDKIFKIINPKIIMVYPHYDEHMFSAINAAHNKGKPVIEIQHGRINSHEAYYYIDDSKIGKYIPDYFFTYGKWWSRQTRLPKGTKVIAVGNPFLENQLKTYADKRDDKLIAFFSGPQTGLELSKFVVECFEKLRKMGYSVIYKLHPNECNVWKKEYPWLKAQEGLEIVAEKSESVYEILSKAGIVVAINSTVLFEASAYPNRNIIILNRGNTDAMEVLVDIGMGTKVNNKDEFFMQIIKSSIINKDIGLMLWEKNSEISTLNAIHEIIKKRKENAN